MNEIDEMIELLADVLKVRQSVEEARRTQPIWYQNCGHELDSEFEAAKKRYAEPLKDFIKAVLEQRFGIAAKVDGKKLRQKTKTDKPSRIYQEDDKTASIISADALLSFRVAWHNSGTSSKAVVAIVQDAISKICPLVVTEGMHSGFTVFDIRLDTTKKTVKRRRCESKKGK